MTTKLEPAKYKSNEIQKIFIYMLFYCFLYVCYSLYVDFSSFSLIMFRMMKLQIAVVAMSCLVLLFYRIGDIKKSTFPCQEYF